MLNRIFFIFCCASCACGTRNKVNGEPSVEIYSIVNGAVVSKGDIQNVTYLYDIGDWIELLCVAKNIINPETYHFDIYIVQNHYYSSKRSPEGNTGVSYAITAYDFDNETRVYCVVTNKISNAVFKSPSLTIIMNPDTISYYSMPEVYYNDSISINNTCDGLGEEYSEFYVVKYFSGTQYYMHEEYLNNITISRSTSTSTTTILFCQNIVTEPVKTVHNATRYSRITYNMTKYIDIEAASHETLPSSTGDKILVIVGVVVCVIILPIIITVTYLWCKRSNKTPAVQFTPPKPHVPLYESISVPIIEGVSQLADFSPLPQRPPLELPAEALEAPSVTADDMPATYDYVYSHLRKPCHPPKLPKRNFNQGIRGRR